MDGRFVVLFLTSEAGHKKTDPLGNSTYTQYDANGNVKKVTNPDGGVIEYEYDLLDRLTKTTEPGVYAMSSNIRRRGRLRLSPTGLAESSATGTTCSAGLSWKRMS